MTRTLPNHDGPGSADGVERLAVELAVPELVVAPGEQPLVLVRQGGTSAAFKRARYPSELLAALKVRPGRTQSSVAITSVARVSAPRKGWRCWSIRPGSTTLDWKVSLTLNLMSPRAAFTSSSEPTARMRLPDRATAVASGWRAPWSGSSSPGRSSPLRAAPGRRISFRPHVEPAPGRRSPTADRDQAGGHKRTKWRWRFIGAELLSLG